MSRRKYYILTYLKTPDDYQVEVLVGTLIDELRRYVENKQFYRWTIYEAMEMESDAHTQKETSR